MIKSYAKILSLFDFGGKVREMFRFVPIEDIDEENVSFFDIDWSGFEEESLEDDLKSGKKASGEFLKEIEVSNISKTEKASETKNAALERAADNDSEVYFVWEKYNRDSYLKNERNNRGESESLIIGKGREGEERQKSGIAPNTVMLSEKEFVKEKKRKDISSDIGTFDENIWLGSEESSSDEKNGYMQMREIGSQQIMMPVLERIERSAERIEQAVMMNSINAEVLSCDEDEQFREKLEVVLRNEMMVNGFECDV